MSRRPRRICSVAYTHYRTDPRVRREAEALAERGDDVTVLALQKEGETGEQYFDGVRVIGLPVARYRGTGARRYLSSYAAFFARAAWFLARHPRRFDVIHVHSIPEAMDFAAVIPKLFGTRVVLDVHDLSTEAYASRWDSTPRGVAIAEKLALRYADAVITVHDRYRDMIVERGIDRQKVTVVHNTPDERIFPLVPPARREGDGFRIVYHGGLLQRNGLETALRAVAELRDRIPGLTFEIYGDGDYRPEMVRLIDELGLGPIVRLSEKAVPVDEIPAAVAGAHVGLVPFLPDRYTATILPTKLLEYVRLGVPAVVSRNPVLESYFGEDAVHVVEPGAVDDLVKAVECVYSDPDQAVATATKAQEFFAHHSWERDRARFYEMIDEVATR